MNPPEIPDSCPFCGSVVSILADGRPCRANDGAWVHFKCLTSMHRGQKPRMRQSRPCEEAERQRLTIEADALRTSNAGLVDRVKRLEDAGDKMAELLDCYGGFDETEEWACSTRSQHIRETRLATDAWAKAKGQP